MCQVYRDKFICSCTHNYWLRYLRATEEIDHTGYFYPWGKGCVNDDDYNTRHAPKVDSREFCCSVKCCFKDAKDKAEVDVLVDTVEELKQKMAGYESMKSGQAAYIMLEAKRIDSELEEIRERGKRDIAREMHAEKVKLENLKPRSSHEICHLTYLKRLDDMTTLYDFLITAAEGE